MENSELREIICNVELKWMERLSNHFQIIFSDVWMPSHDLSHHKRVWYFAREILYINSSKNYTHDFVEALFFACFFHDAGLSKTFDSSHGKISRVLAKSYVDKLPLFNNKQLAEMLDAIEQHDDKSYAEKNNIDSFVSIYKILTLSDDLDALGAIGLYRYLEIYFIRKYDVSSIIGAIKKNLISRWNFIEYTLLSIPEFLNSQKQRYKKSLYFIDRLTFTDVEILFKYFDKKPSEMKGITLTNNFSKGFSDFIIQLYQEMEK